MLVTRRSIFSGITRSIELPITDEQYSNWQKGRLIQLAMPNLTEDQREFILSGATAEEWEALNDPTDV